MTDPVVQDAFSQEPVTTAPVTPPIQPDDINDKLKTIVNEDGTQKYKDVDAAITSLSASQEYIKKLEDEARAREEAIQPLLVKAAEASALEDIVAKLKNPEPAPAPQTPASVGLDEASAKQLFNNMLQEQTQSQVMQSNLQSVNDELVGKFGDKAAEVVTAKATELGVTVDDLMEQSRKAPKSVLAYFGQTAAPVTTPTISSINLGAVPPASSNQGELFKNLLTRPGVSADDMSRAMNAVRDEVYKKHGVIT